MFPGFRVSMIIVAMIVLTMSATASRAAEPLDSSLFSVGACGSVMTGYDGNPYTCEQDRKAVCEYASKRCVCLERKDCGGTRDEPF